MSKNQRVIQILITGLTMGTQMYLEGDLVKEQDATQDLKTLADGKLFLGRRWARWVGTKGPDKTEDTKSEPEAVEPVSAPTEPDKTEDTKSEPEAVEPVSAPTEPDKTEDTVPDLPANVEGVDLDDMIKHLVREGKGKGDIKTELGKLETVTQREVSDKFDEMLATGVLLAGETPGSYTVTE